MVCEPHLDGVLEHSVVQLAESEAEAAAHLGQADRELPHCRPVQIWIRWPFATFANLDEVAVYNFCNFGTGGSLQFLQIWMRWPFTTFANLDEVAVFIFFFWKNLHLELRRAVSTGWSRDIVESSSGLHSLQTCISSRALTNIYLFGCFP